MANVPSTDPNRFGPHSAGLTAFLGQVLELSDEQLSAMATRHRDLDKDAGRTLTECLGRAPLAQRSAVDKVSRETYHQVKGRLRKVGGRLASLSADLALEGAARAIAFPGVVDEEQFDLAVAPFAAVGIDCRALSRMGLVEE